MVTKLVVIPIGYRNWMWCFENDLDRQDLSMSYASMQVGNSVELFWNIVERSSLLDE